MEFNYRGYNHRPSSPYNYFSDLAAREGSWSGGHERAEILRGSADTRETLQLELEKEIIREKIVAEEIASKRALLEAKLRGKRMIEREMAMQSRGYSSSFMVGTPSSHNHWFQPEMVRGQPFAPVEKRIATPFEDNYSGGGFEPPLSQRLPRGPEFGQNRAIDLVKLYGAPPLSGTKRKSPTPPLLAGSSSSKKLTILNLR